MNKLGGMKNRMEIFGFQCGFIAADDAAKRFCVMGAERIDSMNAAKKFYPLIFYHGTTDTLPVRRFLLPPIVTNRKREDWRKKYEDKVFFTTSLCSARKFAKKACLKYGGSPIVYIVRPIGQYFNTINGEYVSDKAMILRVAD